MSRRFRRSLKAPAKPFMYCFFYCRSVVVAVSGPQALLWIVWIVSDFFVIETQDMV